MRGGAVYEGAGLPGLCLGPPTVAELGAHHQEALGRGLWRHQPGGNPHRSVSLGLTVVCVGAFMHQRDASR